jgi:hypothetical protein
MMNPLLCGTPQSQRETECTGSAIVHSSAAAAAVVLLLAAIAALCHVLRHCRVVLLQSSVMHTFSLCLKSNRRSTCESGALGSIVGYRLQSR